MNNEIKLILSSGGDPERAFSQVIDHHTERANKRLSRRRLTVNQKYILGNAARQSIKDDLAELVDRLLFVRGKEG